MNSIATVRMNFQQLTVASGGSHNLQLIVASLQLYNVIPRAIDKSVNIAHLRLIASIALSLTSQSHVLCALSSERSAIWQQVRVLK